MMKLDHNSKTGEHLVHALNYYLWLNFVLFVKRIFSNIS